MRPQNDHEALDLSSKIIEHMMKYIGKMGSYDDMFADLNEYLLYMERRKK